jgi:hypothetical protein
LISCGGGNGGGNLIPRGHSILARNFVSQLTVDDRRAQAVSSVPFGVALGKPGHALVADSPAHTIRRATPGGDVATAAGIPVSSGAEDGSSVRAKSDLPGGLTFGANRDLLTSDSGNECFRKSATEGSTSTVAGVCSFAGFGDGPAAWRYRVKQ